VKHVKDGGIYENLWPDRRCGPSLKDNRQDRTKRKPAATRGEGRGYWTKVVTYEQTTSEAGEGESRELGSKKQTDLKPSNENNDMSDGFMKAIANAVRERRTLLGSVRRNTSSLLSRLAERKAGSQTSRP
jgi:hypothetical protein